MGAMQRARPALWAAALTALALLRGPPAARAGAGAAGAGPVVRCEPCDARALAQCAPPPAASACSELVREPGCGCCLTCALREGQPCGVYTERCGAGLRCQPTPGEPRPLQALLDGRGLCTNASAAGRLRPYLLPAPPAPGEPPVPGVRPQRPGVRRRSAPGRGWGGAVAGTPRLPAPDAACAETPGPAGEGARRRHPPQPPSARRVLRVRSACTLPSAFGKTGSKVLCLGGNGDEVGGHGRTQYQEASSRPWCARCAGTWAWTVRPTSGTRLPCPPNWARARLCQGCGGGLGSRDTVGTDVDWGWVAGTLWEMVPVSKMATLAWTCGLQSTDASRGVPNSKVGLECWYPSRSGNPPFRKVTPAFPEAERKVRAEPELPRPASPPRAPRQPQCMGGPRQRQVRELRGVWAPGGSVMVKGVQ